MGSGVNVKDERGLRGARQAGGEWRSEQRTANASRLLHCDWEKEFWFFTILVSTLASTSQLAAATTKCSCRWWMRTIFGLLLTGVWISIMCPVCDLRVRVAVKCPWLEIRVKAVRRQTRDSRTNRQSTPSVNRRLAACI